SYEGGCPAKGPWNLDGSAESGHSLQPKCRQHRAL
ncbi:hypothetical protein PENNAL_c0277G01565, partial [Penicillium nalgiovense]